MAKRDDPLTAELLAALASGSKTHNELLARIQAALPGTLTFGGHFRLKVERRVRRGLIAKVFVGGRNLYLLPSALHGAEQQFDIADPTDRAVAADWLEERGHEEAAALLRAAKRATCNRRK